ncbi:MAG TPA: hypothetical protein VK168_02315 [Saprospiraceae bacterium]|nr:hypothetical protein [Saprospiraceae bacterium]
MRLPLREFKSLNDTHFMKHFSFLLIVAFGLLLNACQNNSTSSETQEGGDSSGMSASGTDQNIVVSNVKPAKEKDPLNVQVATDLLAAYALERRVKPAYDEAMTMMMTLRDGSADRESVMPMLRDIQQVRNSYEEHQRYSLQLDSLTFKIAGNKLSIEDAQKQYLDTRNALRETESRLAKELERLKAIKSTVEASKAPK